MVVEEHLSIYRYRIIDTTMPAHRKLVHKDLKEIGEIKDIVFAKQKRSEEEIKRYKRWIKFSQNKPIFSQSSQTPSARLDDLAERKFNSVVAKLK